jgi:hypothetical protein
MWTWLEEAIWTELFGPTFENVGPGQLVKSSRRDWIAPWDMYQKKLNNHQSSCMAVLQGSEEVHILRNQIVQQSIWIPTRVFKEGTKTTNTDVSPAGSKNQKQVEMEGCTDLIQECV